MLIKYVTWNDLIFFWFFEVMKNQLIIFINNGGQMRFCGSFSWINIYFVKKTVTLMLKAIQSLECDGLNPPPYVLKSEVAHNRQTLFQTERPCVSVSVRSCQPEWRHKVSNTHPQPNALKINDTCVKTHIHISILYYFKDIIGSYYIMKVGWHLINQLKYSQSPFMEETTLSANFTLDLLLWPFRTGGGKRYGSD